MERIQRLAFIAVLTASTLLPHCARAASFSISAGYNRSCAVNAGSNAFCWGDDISGALGDGPPIFSSSPVPVVGLSAGVARLASSGNSYHTCAVTTSGQALCWGNNASGELGNGTLAPTSVPAPVSGLNANVQAIATGLYHTCALTVSGAALCWGNNGDGQLGYGSIGNYAPTPLSVVGLSSGVKAIAAGGVHTCALTNAGGVLCWGANQSGQLGNGTTASSGSPVQVTGLSTGVVAIGAGRLHSCALTAAGTVSCWGYGGDGELGNGSTLGSSVPVPVAGLTGVTKLAVGRYHTCALKSSGSVVCWGYNGDGGLGNGSTANASTPTAVVGLPAGVGITALALGDAHSCALMTSGTLQCWGLDNAGQLGDGTQNRSLVAIAATAVGGNVTSIVAGQKYTCAVTSSGGAECWGDNSLFQLGDGSSVAFPIPIEVFSGVASISIGSGHACAVDTDADLYCWGNDETGQLGTGSFGANNTNAAQVNIGAKVAQVAAGAFFTCARTVGGAVLCWGANDNGQLGNGTSVFSDSADSPSPVPTVGLSSGVKAIAAGFNHACALNASNAVVCWGANASAQLGDGTTSDRSVPVAAGLSATAISAGGFHSCAVTAAGAALCWGDNANGQVGDGTTTDRRTPSPVTGLSSGVVAISAGRFHSCALTSSGSVMCWGYNGYGQLGNGSTTDSSTPVTVSGLPAGIVSIVAGAFHTCAVTNAGTVHCWGYNSTGGLGNGTFASPRAPTVVANSEPGTLANNDWFLDLTLTKAAQQKSAQKSTIPASETPTFLVTTSGSAATAIVNVNAKIQFRAQDIGHPIYVYAYVPASLVAEASASKDAANCVLAQLTPSGQLQPASASGLQSYVSNVTSTAGQAVSVLNNVAAGNVAGSTFCVGTASTSSQAVSTSNSACAATVPSLAAQGQVCLPPASSVGANLPGALSGLWWNANESGWGIHFTQRGNNTFAAWYTYDTSGNPKWYVSTCTGASGTSGTCNGTLYQVSGPTFFGTTFNPNLVNAVNAGTLQVNFQNTSTASMTYSGVSGQTRTVAIARQPLSNGAVPGVDYTDIWWGGQSESGWGMAITQQASTVFLAWYVYDNSGKPMWYVATCTLSGTTCSGSLLRTTGPSFGPSFNSNQVQSFTVGTVSVNFTDPNNGTLSYTVNGVSGSKNITRQLF